jgi:hypothetical protein
MRRQLLWYGSVYGHSAMQVESIRPVGGSPRKWALSGFHILASQAPLHQRQTSNLQPASTPPPPAPFAWPDSRWALGSGPPSPSRCCRPPRVAGLMAILEGHDNNCIHRCRSVCDSSLSYTITLEMNELLLRIYLRCNELEANCDTMVNAGFLASIISSRVLDSLPTRPNRCRFVTPESSEI